MCRAMMDTERAPGCSPAYDQALSDMCAGVAERKIAAPSAAGGDLPSEHLLHLLWQRQDLLRQPLLTLTQQPVEIYRPGRWSRGSGPDFLEAKLRLGDDPLCVGAVEVHVLASDWTRHGHHLDAAYGNVRLHIVWHNDLPTPTVRDVSGREIPQLCLLTSLAAPLTDLQPFLDDDRSPGGVGAGLTPCQRSLMEMAPETVGLLLDMAGDERWRQKANRLALRVERRGAEQALYETLMEALGYQGNRLPFWQLARVAPLDRIRQALVGARPTTTQLQAILYGVSGWLTRWQAQHTPRQAIPARYLADLTACWEALRAHFPESIDERQWRTVGIRPANFPYRRIAAASYWLAELSQQTLLDFCFTPLYALAAEASAGHLRRCARELAGRLAVRGEEDFWRHRYTLDGAELDRGVDLLGPGRATTMVVDVVLPAAVALAHLGTKAVTVATVQALYRCHPRLPANEITREMSRQCFGADRGRAAIVNSALRQQALIHLYREFCLNERETCLECALPRLVARLERP